MSDGTTSNRERGPESVPGDSLPRSLNEQQAANVTHLETMVSYVLRFGVLLSLTITFIGLVLLFVADPSNAIVRPTGPGIPHSPLAVLTDLLRLKPKAIIDTGLILLILTPVFRVGVTVVAFSFERDWQYAAITLFVLAVLVASFFLGVVA